MAKNIRYNKNDNTLEKVDFIPKEDSYSDYGENPNYIFMEEFFDFELNELPFCCGIQEIGNFNTEILDDIKNMLNLNSISKEDRQEIIKALTANINNDITDRTKTLYIAALLDKPKIYHEVFEKLKFKKTISFINGNSSNKLTVYIKKL